MAAIFRGATRRPAARMRTTADHSTNGGVMRRRSMSRLLLSGRMSAAYQRQADQEGGTQESGHALRNHSMVFSIFNAPPGRK